MVNICRFSATDMLIASLICEITSLFNNFLIVDYISFERNMINFDKNIDIGFILSCEIFSQGSKYTRD